MMKKFFFIIIVHMPSGVMVTPRLISLQSNG